MNQQEEEIVMKKNGKKLIQVEDIKAKHTGKMKKKNEVKRGLVRKKNRCPKQGKKN